MKFLEIETKYDASHIELDDFHKLIQNLGPSKSLDVAGFDYYYTKKNSFIRYRAGKDCSELTMKTKRKEANNYVRVEANLPLDSKVSALDMRKIVEKICKMLGYKQNFAIWKTCYIYWFDKYNVVYYVVSDKNMVEKARFIEIEMSESHMWLNTKDAWTNLVRVEKTLAPLGITAKGRLSKSLFEMFKC